MKEQIAKEIASRKIDHKPYIDLTLHSLKLEDFTPEALDEIRKVETKAVYLKFDELPLAANFATLLNQLESKVGVREIVVFFDREKCPEITTETFNQI